MSEEQGQSQLAEIADRSWRRYMQMPSWDQIPTQGERIAIPEYPEPTPKHDGLTEVCQLFGKPISVRLDWRDPETAKEELDRMRFTIKDAFSRAYGWFEERPEEQEAFRDANTKVGEQ